MHGFSLSTATTKGVRRARHERHHGGHDFFKNINDVYGYPAGDSALRHAAACLLAGVRATDVLARVGGEEFTVFQRIKMRWEGLAGPLRPHWKTGGLPVDAVVTGNRQQVLDFGAVHDAIAQMPAADQPHDKSHYEAEPGNDAKSVHAQTG